jgi:hypothetical protein
MPFFEMPPRPQVDDEEDDDARFDIDDLASLYVGGVVPLQLVIARSEVAAVVVREIVAFPDGFEFTVCAYTRRRPDDRPRGRRRPHVRPMHAPFDWELDNDDEEEEGMPPGFLRFGIEFPDGARVTNLNPPWLGMTEDATDPQHGLEGGGGSGSDSLWTQDYWAWPVPDEGTLVLACEWPAFDIAETLVEVDAGVIRQAAEQARPVWPDQDGMPSHVTRRSMMSLHWGSVMAFGRRDESEGEAADSADE